MQKRGSDFAAAAPLMLAVATLTAGCAAMPKGAADGSPTRAGDYLPVSAVWKSIRIHPGFQGIAGDPREARLPAGGSWQFLGYSPSSGFLLMRLEGSGLSAAQTLYTLNPETGGMRTIAADVLDERQIIGAAIGDGWVAWQVGDQHGPYGDDHNNLTLHAENLATGALRTVGVPGVRGGIPDFAYGLAIRGGDLYWTNTATPKGSSDTASAIYAYSLQDGHLTEVLRDDMQEDGRLIEAMSLGPSDILYCVAAARNMVDVSAAPAVIMQYDTQTGHSSKILDVWHGTQRLLAGVGAVVLTDDDHQTPKSVADPAPYPWYLYRFASPSVDEIIPQSSPAEVLGSNGRFLAISNLATAGVLDTKTWTEYTQANALAQVFGQVLAWITPGDRTLHWATLP